MSKRLFACSLLIVFVTVSAGAQAATDNDLPDGPMQNKARTACLMCHDSHIVVQQRLSKAAWGKEVDKMIKWGAIVSASDRDALVDYLSTNFPPEKPAHIAKRSASSKH
jgi:hypothetical protein